MPAKDGFLHSFSVVRPGSARGRPAMGAGPGLLPGPDFLYHSRAPGRPPGGRIGCPEAASRPLADGGILNRCVG